MISDSISYQNDRISPDTPSVIAPTTIYVGGGTPSLLSVDTWKHLDDALFSDIDKSNLREWSVECNPESFTIEKARAYANSGVTRLTFGVQSLNPRELSTCGRAHSPQKAFEILSGKYLSKMFASIGADIIYGLPGQSVSTLNETLIRILSIPHVKHLSAYELTIGENTLFGRHQKLLPLPDDDAVAEMYGLIGRRCAERGMAQYEVSNYALPGFESIHNNAYWSHKPYIGLGASAHTYIHPKRLSNIADVRRYISAISSNSAAVDFEETLTPADTAREMIFLGLRNVRGIDEHKLAELGVRLDERRLQKFIARGHLRKSGARYIPTSGGMLFADMLARELTD